MGKLDSVIKEWDFERADRCYECTGYGDDCPWNRDWEDD